MKRKREFLLYIGMWLIATLFLLTFLWQSIGDARGVNYSGIVRGGTQKLVKEELNGQRDDDLMAYLDDIIYDLQTGKGAFNLDRNRDKEYQELLLELKQVWEDIKAEIEAVRKGVDQSDQLYELSQQHFKIADKMVARAEEDSNTKIARCIVLYCLALIISVTFFVINNRRNRTAIDESLSRDKLTGLLSRKGFEETAADILHKNVGCKFITVEFDIDNFKSINKTFGYAQGDELLRSVAQRLLAWEGENEICTRIDADSFVLLCEQRDDFISDLLNLLKQTAKQQTALESFGDIAFTMGVYKIENNDELIKSAMDKANTAHKAAKRFSHRDIVFYDEELIEKIERETKYQERMQHGLDAEEFKVYLQPKVELKRLDVIGAEALVRWEIPDIGKVRPDEYIPLFEKNGSIIKLDYYMLDKTCSYLRKQLNKGISAFTVSVNFSRVTLYHEGFYDTILEIVDSYELPHHYIEVEVTESAFDEISDTIFRTLQKLNAAGFYISMDDFGAGYSNLNLLSRLPIQIIKLDREFICDMTENKKVRGIISCVVDMAHAMGLKVICEGVEQEEHVQFLRKIGCDYAQGYYFSKPIPKNEFEEIYQSFGESEYAAVPLTAQKEQESPEYFEIEPDKEDIFGEILLRTYPGFLSLRNEKHEIVYLNNNFKEWIQKYTDVDPLGKTNVELSSMVPENVADTFMQCHDGSLELQKDMGNRMGLKKVIEFKGSSETDEPSQYFDVLKFWVKVSNKPLIFTIAYDITNLYLENMHNLQSSMTDSLTGVRNRRYLQSEIALYYGHYAALFDLDHFKMINDKEGHIVGDKILREFVSFIEERVPNMVLMIRLGGDEFLAIFKKEETEESIRAALNRARALYEETYSQYSYLSFSAGVDLIGQQVDETLRRLDKRMYEDKKR